MDGNCEIWCVCCEVIVISGVIVLLQLLQCLGVGYVDELCVLGIYLVVYLFGVGENLQDYLEMYIQYECLCLVFIYENMFWYNKFKVGLEWYMYGIGFGVSNYFEVGGFICSDDSFEWLNIQYYFLLLVVNYDGSNLVKMYGFQCYVGLMCLLFRGYVKFVLCDLCDKLCIFFNYMVYDVDWCEFCVGVWIMCDIIVQCVFD